MKNVNNFQIAKFQPQGAAWHLIDFLPISAWHCLQKKCVIICIYLRTSDRHFGDQGNVRHLTSMLLKCDLVQTLNNSRNPSFRIFAAGKASFVMSFNTVSITVL